MPFIAECPYCHQRVRVRDHAIGLSFTCPVCSECYTLAACPTPQTERAPPRTCPRQPPEAPAPEPPPSPAPASAATAPAPQGDEAPPAPEPRPRPVTGATEERIVLPAPRPRAAMGAGLMSFVLGSVALLCASLPYGRLLTIPLSVLGLLAGIVGLTSAMGVKGRVLSSAGSVISLLTLLLAGVWPLLSDGPSGRGKFGGQGASSSTVTLPCGKTLRAVPSDGGDWVDAGDCALRQSEVCVGVASVAVEPVPLSDGGKRWLSKEKGLIIRLQLVCTGTKRKVTFASWGTASQLGGADSPHLKDDPEDRTYRPLALAAGTDVVGREPRPDLYPKLYADDVLVFEAPRADVKSLRLELPASAFGGTGTLRLRIPGTMIKR